MGSTSNALDKGGDNFKKLFEDSSITSRNSNGQTKSGLYSLFIPMEWNFEGYIDRYGHPVLDTPKKEVKGIDGTNIYIGANNYWNRDTKKSFKDMFNDCFNQYDELDCTHSYSFVLQHRDNSNVTPFNENRAILVEEYSYDNGIINKINLNDRTSYTFNINKTYNNYHELTQSEKVKKYDKGFTPDMSERVRKSFKDTRVKKNKLVDIAGVIKSTGDRYLGTLGNLKTRFKNAKTAKKAGAFKKKK